MATLALEKLSPRKAIELARSSQSRLQRLRSKINEGQEAVTAGFETVGTAFAVGGIQGRYGELALGPVPAALLSGLALYAAGIFVGGKSAPHLYAFGTGCMSAWATTVGTGLGNDLRKKALTSADGMAGDYSSPDGQQGGGVLTDQEQGALADSI